MMSMSRLLKQHGEWFLIQRWVAMFVSVAIWVGLASGQRAPHIGYAYPAGGKQGSTFRVMVGGQHLQGSTNVFVSGEGVTAVIVKFTRKYEPRRLRQIWRNKQNAIDSMEGKEGKELQKIQRRIEFAEKQMSIAEVPDGVDVNDWKAVQRAYRIDGKEQFNPQLTDRLRIDITIGENAHVKGDVTAGEVKVFGRVEGKITSEKCELKEKSRLEGDIKTKNLSMDPGASMSGRTEIGG